MGTVAALLCLLSCAASAAATEPSIDSIYLEVGRGDTASATQHAVALLAQTPQDGAMRGAILRAQLDICIARDELIKPTCAALSQSIAEYVARPGADAFLGRELKIAQLLAHGDAQAALALAQEALRHASAADLPEIRVIVARSAALTPGQLALAREQVQLALPEWQKISGARARLHEGELYYISANVYERTGRQSDALSELEKGLQVIRTSFGEASPSRFLLDADRAGVLANMGRQRDALEIREALLVAAKTYYGERSFEVAKAEGLVGASLQEIGDYPSARAHYEQAERLVAANPNAPSTDRGLIAANYANLLQEMGDEPAALEHQALALKLWGDSETTMHARAVVSANMGNTEFRLQHYPAAIADFERALALREKSDGKESPGLAYALEGLGSTSLALNQYAAAESYYRRALDLRSRAFTPNHPTVAPLHFGLALALWGEGNEREAFKVAVDTAQHQQTLLQVFAADFSERQSVAYRELLMPATALVVTLAARRGDGESIATAWRLAMLERGLLARAQTRQLAAARATADPQMAATFAAWRQANSALGEAWLARTPDAAQIAALQADAERKEQALWRRAGQSEPASPVATIDIAQLAQALPPQSTLIAYSEGVVADPARQLVAGDKQAPEDWYAFTLGADRQPHLQRIGDIQAISAQARAWYVDLRNPDSELSRLRREGTALRKILLDGQMTHDVQRIFIVPEGDLYRLSFAALPDDRDGYLIESGLRVHTLAHETDLALSAANRDSGKTLLAGAPDFPVSVGPASVGPSSMASRSLCQRAAQEGFAAIPNAGRELDDLNVLLNGITAHGEIQLVRGNGATKQHVLDALPNVAIAHLATHGFSLDESCADASTSRGVSIDVQPAASANGSAPSVTFSGLAFSGANVGNTQAPVGVITAGELAALDLSGLSWIALSSCDSGLGPIGRNEGVFGMRRALRLAGARTVVMSLWQVDDAATADLMGALYRQHFVDHRDVPDAMAAAMRSVIEQRRAAHLPNHPYYWAAFVSEGAWR